MRVLERAAQRLAATHARWAVGVRCCKVYDKHTPSWSFIDQDAFKYLYVAFAARPGTVP